MCSGWRPCQGSSGSQTIFSLRSRTLGRFDCDEPPSYKPSTDEEEEYAMFHPALGLNGGAVLGEFKDFMEGPLDSHEQI